MEIEITEGRTLIQTVLGPPCKECEEEKAEKDVLEEKLADSDRVTLSGQSSLDAGVASGIFENRLDDNRANKNQGSANEAGPRTEAELSSEEKQVLDDLKARDREVRAHEQAHLAAAGPYAKGPPSFEFQTGPRRPALCRRRRSPDRHFQSRGQSAGDSGQGPDHQTRRQRTQEPLGAGPASRGPGRPTRSPGASGDQGRAPRKAGRSFWGRKKPSGKSCGKRHLIFAKRSTSIHECACWTRQTSGNSGSNLNPRIQNLLKNFSATATEDKGKLLDTVS